MALWHATVCPLVIRITAILANVSVPRVAIQRKSTSIHGETLNNNADMLVKMFITSGTCRAHIVDTKTQFRLAQVEILSYHSRVEVRRVVSGVV